jgi:hypothetical protein
MERRYPQILYQPVWMVRSVVLQLLPCHERWASTDTAQFTPPVGAFDHVFSVRFTFCDQPVSRPKPSHHQAKTGLVFQSSNETSQ